MMAFVKERESRMLDGHAQEEMRHAIFDLAEAAMAIMDKTSLVHAAAARAIETRRRAEIERFLRHLARLDDAERIRISKRRDAILFERWTRAAFGPAGLREWEL